MSLYARKIIQYRSAAMVNMASHMIAPILHRINAPKNPITHQRIIDARQLMGSSASILSKSILPASEKTDSGFFKSSSLFKGFPKLSFNFQPRYKPVVIKTRKIAERIDVDRTALKKIDL